MGAEGGHSAGTSTRVAAALCAVAYFVGIARAEPGEYTGVVTLLAHGPEGTNPLVLDVGVGNMVGSATLDVDVKGHLTGSLLTTGSAVPVTGSLRWNAKTSKVALRSSKAQAVSFHGSISGQQIAGRLSDKHGFLGGTGDLRIDLSHSSSLSTRVFLAFANSPRSALKCFAVVTAGASTLKLAASSKAAFAATRLKTAGSGISLVGVGHVQGAAFALDTFSMSAFGVSIAGTGGQLGYAANPPDITLILASGHPVGVASDALPYLANANDAGPAIESALVAAGYRVESHAFIDYYYDTANGRGYLSLVATLKAARDTYVKGRAFPTKVVVVDHSHGGVRAHQGLEEVPDLPVRLLVDLDASSCDFNVGHALEPAVDPVCRWLINGVEYDDEDVVTPNVDFDLEVRSDSYCPSILLEYYDDSYNVRMDGTRTGLFYYDANTNHTEVHQPGASLDVAIAWMLQHI